MYSAQLALLYCLLNVVVGVPVSERSPSGEPAAAKPTKEVKSNIFLQSTDGGKTWQDVSRSLPEIEQPEGFFVGTSDIYVRTRGVLYHSKRDLKTPVWEKEDGIDQMSTIAVNRSGALAYSFDGDIYQKKTSSEKWSAIYTDFKSKSVASFFEASDGTLFFSTGKSFSRSTDKAQNWKLVQNGWVGDVVEADGVLLATGQKGIMRSTDGGEHWEWVISEGGVGIAIERMDGGFVAIAYNSQTKSRRIHISSDGGKTWQVISDGLPPSALISSAKQLGNQLFVGHPDGIFRSSDRGKSWQLVQAGFGNVTQVFKFISVNSTAAPVERVYKIYVSGNTLYAVAVAAGC